MGQPHHDERLGEQARDDGVAFATVLLVEDEPLLRTLAARVLRSLRYAVIEADGGPSALELADAGTAFDAVLTDLLMPQMSGVELVERLRRTRPMLRVLFMSGHSPWSAFREADLPADTPFLGKPFGRDELADALRALLAEPETPRA